MFAEHVAVANLQPCRLSAIFQVLRRLANDRSGEELIARAGGGVPRQVCLRADNTLRAENHIAVDDSVWTDTDSAIQLCVRVDDLCWMDHFAPPSGAQNGLREKRIRTPSAIEIPQAPQRHPVACALLGDTAEN